MQWSARATPMTALSSQSLLSANQMSLTAIFSQRRNLQNKEYGEYSEYRNGVSWIDASMGFKFDFDSN